MTMKNTVFIRTNDKQIAGAITSARSLKRNSRRRDGFGGQISRQQIEAEMRSNHVRHDALEVMARVAPLDQILGDVKLAA